VRDLKACRQNLEHSPATRVIAMYCDASDLSISLGRQLFPEDRNIGPSNGRLTILSVRSAVSDSISLLRTKLKSWRTRIERSESLTPLIVR
jgi:hypothetical protein